MPVDLMIQIAVNHKETTEELACAPSALIAAIS
jgi:hypothetical protein